MATDKRYVHGMFANPRSGRLVRYDTTEHEHADGLDRRSRPWTRDDVLSEIGRRARTYLDAHELTVHYYRIGFQFAFRLPVADRPTEFPTGILGEKPYPWLIWLGWELEERWRVLAAASRLIPELSERAESTLAQEFSAFAGWSSFDGDGDHAALMTAAVSSAVADVLSHASDHSDAVIGPARIAANRIVSESIGPWVVAAWPAEPPYEMVDMHNIRCITLLRGAQLATVAQHEHAPALRERAAQVFGEWLRLRQQDSEPLVEGAAYDGYLLDTVTEWLPPDLRPLGAEALSTTVSGWAHLALPGRIDLLAPIGDTEGEMTFWASAAARICRWYGLAPETVWLRRFPLSRLPGGALADASLLAELPVEGSDLVPGRHEQLSTVTVRTGWDAADILVAVGASRTPMGHLHFDGGNVVIGWRNRFWITDPGYQQYRAGAERDYTIGPLAHNVPVIAGIAQTIRAATLLNSAADTVSLDLTGCYGGLPPDAQVRRDVALAAGTIAVRDTITGLAPGTDIATNWLIGAGLALSFVDGQVRISDGHRALWIATSSGDLNANDVLRHEGTRGALHLCHHGAAPRWWIFVTDEAGGWDPPADRIDAAIAQQTSR